MRSRPSIVTTHERSELDAPALRSDDRRPIRPSAVAVLASAIVLVSGCGGDGSTAEGADGRATTTAAGVDRPDDIVGRWAHYDVVAYSDAAMKTLIISYGFTDFEMRDDDLFAQEVFCTARQASDQPIETEISDAATRAIEPPLAPASASGGPGAWRVTRPATPTPVGVRLEDPANEPLPTDPADPRISDDDGDGKPGVTVTVKAEGGDPIGELYIARREIFAYEVDQTTEDEFVGTVTDSSEQLVVGSSNPALAIPTSWTQYPDLSKSPIVLKRADQDWDCDRLIVEIPALFGEPPDVDW